MVKKSRRKTLPLRKTIPLPTVLFLVILFLYQRELFFIFPIPIFAFDFFTLDMYHRATPIFVRYFPDGKSEEEQKNDRLEIEKAMRYQ